MNKSCEWYTADEFGTNDSPRQPKTSVELLPVALFQEILIGAEVQFEGDSPFIDFVTSDPNIALHISIKRDMIVRNSRNGNEYDHKTEETEQNLCDPSVKQPIKSNTPFSMLILLADEKFHIAIDDKCYCTFKYRMPIQGITRIDLCNFISITRVDHHCLHPPRWPLRRYVNQDLTFSNDIPKPFKKYQVLVVTGTPVTDDSSKAGDIDIYFNSHNSNRELFLMRISMETSKILFCAMDEKRNYVNERIEDFCFMANELFKIGFSCLDSKFGIAINGETFEPYNFIDKEALDKMTGINIRTKRNLKLDLSYVKHEFFQNENIPLRELTQLPESSVSTDLFFCGLACPVNYLHSIYLKAIAGSEPNMLIDLKPKTTHCDITLRLTVDFQGNMIIRNTLKDAKWGEPESTENLCDPKKTNPIQRGKQFEMSFVVGFERFHITIDGDPFCTYKHRLPFQTITQVRVQFMGQVIQMDHRTPLPSPWPARQLFLPRRHFSNDIPIKFTPGHVVLIAALPRKNWVMINFYDRFVARNLLHISIRYNKKETVVAYLIGEDKWEGPDSIKKFPFKENQKFKVAIGFHAEKFKIAANGVFLCDFKYPVDQLLERVTSCNMIVDNKDPSHLKVLYVHHCFVDKELTDFEKYSRWDNYCP